MNGPGSSGGPRTPGLYWRGSVGCKVEGLGDRLLVLRTVDKKTAARKPPLPIGDKKVAAPAGGAHLDGVGLSCSNEYRYRLVFRNEKPRRR